MSVSCLKPRAVLTKDQAIEILRLSLPQSGRRTRPTATSVAVEQLGHKIKEEMIITVSVQAAGDEVASSAATCAQQKHQYPSRTLCYSVSLALQAPQAVKKEKPDNREIRVRDAKQLCAEIRKERADELAGVGMANNAARKRRAMAVLKSTLAKQ